MSSLTTVTSAFAFNALTPDTILDGIESVGLRVDSGLTPLNSYENRVYQFMDEDRRRYVVKFYRPERWTPEQILEEHGFVYELAEAEIPAVAALEINKTTLHHYQGYMFAIFPSVGGRQYELDNEDQLEWVGRFLGRIHMVGKRCIFAERPTIGLNEYLYQSREVLSSCLLIPTDLRVGFSTALNQLISELEQFWQDDLPLLRLHGDCHAGNILWRDGPLFVDFDDARNGPAVQDLWMLLHGDRQEQIIQLDILLEAYNEFAEFDLSELALIEPLRGMRMIYFLAWVVRRWQDPAFPMSFPWMTEAQFWQQQQQLFIQQIKSLRAPPLQLMPYY